MALIAVGIGALIYAGSSWRKSYWAMVASAMLFLAAAGFSIWSFTVQLDVADAGSDMSFLAPWTLAAFWVIAGSIVLFATSCLVSLRHAQPSTTV